MTGDLKVDIINTAYKKGRISGLTSKPTSENLADALFYLENLAAEWEGQPTICVGYNFEDEPDLNSPHNIDRTHWNAFASNLALRILPDFGKVPVEGLSREASTTFSRLSAFTSQTRQVQPSRRMPTGSGNNRYGNRFGNRFYRPAAQAPADCATERMIIGDIDNFVEHFDSYLNAGEDISSYVLTADTGVTIVTESMTTTDVLYEVRADGANNEFNNDAFLQVKIVATTTTGRIETRVINFELTEA